MIARRGVDGADVAKFRFDLVSPEKLLFYGEVDQVDVPGTEGDFGVLADHAQLISMLRPGILTSYDAGGAMRVVVYRATSNS
jgi:F-type H+-transporting ATPase subunit epsilon